MLNVLCHDRCLFKLLTLWLVVGAVVLPLAKAEELALDTVGLWLQENETKIRDDDLKLVASVADLTELDLTGCGNITDSGVAHLLSLSKLKTLNLSSCRRLTPNVFETLCQMKSLQEFSAEQAVSHL